MLDLPHLRQARRILALAAATARLINCDLLNAHMKHPSLICPSLSLLFLGGCRPPDPQPVVDMAAMRAAMQEHTETLLLIHFKLDNALKEISAAETTGGGGRLRHRRLPRR